MKYAFILGREPALSTAEILTVLKTRNVPHDPKTFYYSTAALVIETGAVLEADFFRELGGSIKMLEVLREGTNVEDEAFDILMGLGRASLDFGISAYYLYPGYRGNDSLKYLSLTLKKRLKAEGLSARVVLPTQGSTLTSVQVDKNKLITKGAELVLLMTETAPFIARTMAVQEFEAFGLRDFERPGVDAKSGMLPPKLARMMVNLAGAPKNGVLLDAFCGSGTVLTEAAHMGYRKLWAADISERAVADTKKNLEWLASFEGASKPSTKVLLSDVKFLAEKLSPASVDAIVSEPFLGPPLRGGESDQKIHFIYLELMGLYRRAFETFAKILKPGGDVVFVFPVFGSKHINLLRELESLGFRAEALLPGQAAAVLGLKSPVGLTYKRPDQKVGREIFRFRFKG
jgi:tRNA G10  N-methylase Trm11